MDTIKEIDELAYDILMSLRADMPISTENEYKLCVLLDECDLSVLSTSENLRELTEYFLDNGIDRAWNIGNLLLH